MRRALKRLLDIVVAATVLVGSAPLLAAAAVAVKIASRGRVLFRQRRVGENGKEFTIFKFRTMVEGAEQLGPGLALDASDARITAVGRLLRRFSIDELPNLVNVLKGEMSLVGPRPTLAKQVARYDDRQRLRLTVKPGITGWAQINGRAALPWHERIELDIWYVEHGSLWLDLKILVKTALLLVSGRGLYKGSTGGWRDAE